MSRLVIDTIPAHAQVTSEPSAGNKESLSGPRCVTPDLTYSMQMRGGVVDLRPSRGAWLAPSFWVVVNAESLLRTVRPVKIDPRNVVRQVGQMRPPAAVRPQPGEDY
jgi:hypothetical protein